VIDDDLFRLVSFKNICLLREISLPTANSQFIHDASQAVKLLQKTIAVSSLEKNDQSLFKIIFFDMQMKGLSAAEFTKLIKQSYKSFNLANKTPIMILYTAVPESEVKLKCTFKYHAYL
jgi:CheY-like chemotaxis protein